MSSENYSLITPQNGLFSSPSIPPFQLFICSFLFLAMFSFWLSPGGLAWAFSTTKTRPKSAIPGPSGFPLLGLVFTFTSSLTHRALASLAQSFKATPLMAFSVGFTRFVISSQPDSAKEILNSPAFANRPVKESAYELLFHRAMGFAPYGEYWRKLRRISATHLFCPKRVAQYGEFRREIGVKMVGEIKGIMVNNGEVKVKRVLYVGSLNNIMMSLFGKMYEFSESGDGFELEGLVKEGYELLGVFNWSDHFPILGIFDLQGVRKRCRNLVSKVNVFVGEIIKEHRVKRDKINGGGVDERFGDFVDVLLDLEKDNMLNDSDMIAVLWVFFF